MSRLIARLSGLVAPLTRGMTLGVRGAAIDGEGRVLLVRHAYVAGWYLPGGGVERGESMIAALDRELREEAGIVRAGPAELLGIYWNARQRRDHVAVYVCRAFGQPEKPKLPNREIAEIGFFAPDRLPDGTTPATQRRLAEIFAGERPDPLW